MKLFVGLLAAFLFAPGAASAGFVESAIFTWLASSGVAVGTATVLATSITRFVVGLGLSLLGQLFQEKPKVKQRGIQTEQTTSGDVTPLTFILGRYATEGHLISPGYSRGKNNKILTYIVDISNVPVSGLSGRVAINGEWTNLVADGSDPDKYWFADLGDGTKGWLWFFDGTQSAAFSHLVAEYGSHPDRPWTSDHIIEGGAYAVMEFEFDREVYSGFPRFRFEVDGIPLYDPRKDSTVGGSGTHRWNDASTWEFTKNPQVINYNIMRGITLPTGDIYGGLIPAEDLPLDNWFAAMNACDALIGTRVTYEAGFEVDVSQEPFDVIKEMNKASFAQMSELGGVFKVRVGAPASPVLSITDDDIVITKPSDLNPFPGLAQTSNAITGTYIEPNDVWQGRAADPIYNATWEADDGDRRLTTDVGLPAVSNKSQAQHLLNSYINDNRRFATHGLVLPASFATLEPLDTIEWTSERNGYVAKVFEVVELEDQLDTMLQFVRVREREATDNEWSSGDDVAAPPPVNTLTPLADLTVDSWAVTAGSVADDTGTARRPKLTLSWDATDIEDVHAIAWQVRVKATTEVVAEGTYEKFKEASLEVSEGLLPSVEYEARAEWVADVPTAPTSWLAATTPGTFLSAPDFAPGAIKAPLGYIDVEAVLTSDASFQFKHPGMVVVFAIGAGGSGGAASNDSNQRCAASGGGAGAMVSKFLRDVNTSDTYNITIGAGGPSPYTLYWTGNEIALPGNDGGDTSMVGGSGDTAINITAGGGKAGAADKVSTGTAFAAGGLGGTGSGGDFNYPGGRGGNATQNTDGKAASGSGCINLDATSGTVDGEDVVNEVMTDSARRSQPMLQDLREMQDGAMPFMYYNDYNWTGARAVDNTNNFCAGGGGAAKYDGDFVDTEINGGDGILFVFYLGERSLI